MKKFIIEREMPAVGAADRATHAEISFFPANNASEVRRTIDPTIAAE
jgi:hypothetical protein